TLTVERQQQDNASYTYFMSKPARGDPGKFDFACLGPVATRCSFNEPDGQSHVRTDNAFLTLAHTTEAGALTVSTVATRRKAPPPGSPPARRCGRWSRPARRRSPRC